ncbi:MAG: Lrp/AsnC ligand binding domain-containing protein [Chloroflexi bacterium]|nr:Lrp/AsnC ligand binding domain-containing protein [Chloroflexota bacterium]
MSQTAYVLIDTEVGKSREIVQTLRRASGVREVHIVTGPHSLIAVYEGTDANTIGRLVMDSVHSIPGVLRTITCLSLDN